MGIGERCRPDPRGRPGFLRLDTVHQEDWDGAKGVYHIHAVDAITQWQVVGCASKFTERFLLPVLEAVLEQFPFAVLGFHVDNGSEYINHPRGETVGEAARGVHQEPGMPQSGRRQERGGDPQTDRLWAYPGRPRRSDREILRAALNPYLNFHRPCGFATVSLDERDKRRRQYKIGDYWTPFEKLKSLEEAARYLKPGLSLAELEKQALCTIPTTLAYATWKNGKPKTGPLFHPAHATATLFLGTQKSKKGSRPLRGLLIHLRSFSPGRAQTISCSSFDWKMLRPQPEQMPNPDRAGLRLSS
jgi:hypothetical protein